MLSNFYLGRPNGFFELSQALKSPCFGQIFCAAGKILQNQAKKGVSRQFLENLNKNRVFLARASRSKLVYIGALRKNLGSVSQNGYSK